MQLISLTTCCPPPSIEGLRPLQLFGRTARPDRVHVAPIELAILRDVQPVEGLLAAAEVLGRYALETHQHHEAELLARDEVVALRETERAHLVARGELPQLLLAQLAACKGGGGASAAVA